MLEVWFSLTPSTPKVAFGDHTTQTRFKGATKMNRVVRYTAADMPELMDKILKYSIGAEDWFERVGALHETTKNYPPYNVIHESNVKQVVEIALAGFKKAEVFVYTEHGKLFVEGQKEDKETDVNYSHKGIAQRSFTRSWTLTEDWRVDDVQFEDGLLRIELQKVVPEHFQRQDFL